MERNDIPYFGVTMTSWMQKLDDDDGGEDLSKRLPVIPQPQTPSEPMEFLARSWTPSAADVTEALARKPKHDVIFVPQLSSRVMSDRRSGSIGRWFQTKEASNDGQVVKKKDKERLENAHVHATISIASLAAGLASVSAADSSNNDGTASSEKMKMAKASATELLASHCVHLAELAGAGAGQDGLASVVRSSVDIRTAGDLLTLTAAAATALRAEATLRARLPKDAKKNTTISPCDRGVAELKNDSFHSDSRKQDRLCKGELLQQIHKGTLRWKRVTVYVNKKSQVIVKIKNKHFGGTFSKNRKCVVYGVCDEVATWPFVKEKQESEEAVCLGLKTGKGFLEFKCKSKIQKQKWVDGIRSLLSKVGNIELGLWIRYNCNDIISELTDVHIH